MNHKHTEIFAHLQAHLVVKGQQLTQRIDHVVDSNFDAEGKRAMSKGAKHGAILGALAAGQLAFAAAAPGVAPSILTNTSTAMCTVANALQGPVGMVLVIGAIIVGGMSLVIGGKKSMSYLIGAVIGGGVIFTAKSLAGMFMDTTQNTCGLT
jgi:type IV secretory pathway VirB2 component (pilin)